MWRCADNQEVGLEAAILERVRNSSLVECHRADNPTGQSPLPKPRTGGLEPPVVGERRRRREARAQAVVERLRVRMPERVTEKWGANPHQRKPEGSAARVIRGGVVGPKAQAQAVADGQPVDIPVLVLVRLTDGRY
jgi:hypothetical protein